MPAPSPRLNLVVLRSPDIERAVRFYSTLGLVFTSHAHGSGPAHYASENSGMVFEIYPQTAKSGSSAGARVGFVVEALDELAARLVAAGGQLVSSPADSEWGRRAVLKDPDGHSVELVVPKVLRRSYEA